MVDFSGSEIDYGSLGGQEVFLSQDQFEYLSKNYFNLQQQLKIVSDNQEKISDNQQDISKQLTNVLDNQKISQNDFKNFNDNQFTKFNNDSSEFLKSIDTSLINLNTSNEDTMKLLQDTNSQLLAQVKDLNDVTVKPSTADHVINIYGLIVFPGLLIIYALSKMIRPFL